MNVRPFDPSKVVGYGTSGPINAQAMNDILEVNRLSLTYNEQAQEFTILNSSEISVDIIETIFKKRRYDGYHPQVIGTDALGNRLVKLKAIDPSASLPSLLRVNREETRKKLLEIAKKMKKL